MSRKFRFYWDEAGRAGVGSHTVIRQCRGAIHGLSNG